MCPRSGNESLIAIFLVVYIITIIASALSFFLIFFRFSFLPFCFIFPNSTPWLRRTSTVYVLQVDEELGFDLTFKPNILETARRRIEE